MPGSRYDTIVEPVAPTTDKTYTRQTQRQSHALAVSMQRETQDQGRHGTNTVDKSLTVTATTTVATIKPSVLDANIH